MISMHILFWNWGFESGVSAPPSTPAITVLEETQQKPCPDNVETQLPCSPSELPNTDTALKHLNQMDEKAKEMQEQVHNSKICFLEFKVLVSYIGMLAFIDPRIRS